MAKKANEPLCKNPHCQEDSIDMVEKHEHKRYTRWFCNTCSHSWVVAKTSDAE